MLDNNFNEMKHNCIRCCFKITKRQTKKQESILTMIVMTKVFNKRDNWDFKINDSNDNEKCLKIL